MRIDLTCANCQQNRFNYPPDDDDAAMVTCGDCGFALGSVGALKQAVANAVLNGDRAPDAYPELGVSFDPVNRSNA